MAITWVLYQMHIFNYCLERIDLIFSKVSDDSAVKLKFKNTDLYTNS